MTGDKLVDARRMFKHACEFMDCAKFCEFEPKNIRVSCTTHLVADIVNSSFACEVFIKSLLIYHGKTIKAIHGHKLDILWNKYRAVDSENAALVERSMKEFFGSSNNNMFNEHLLKISDAFQYWRYIYEKQEGSIQLQFLCIFREMLREVCCKKLHGMTWDEFINIKNRS